MDDGRERGVNEWREGRRDGGREGRINERMAVWMAENGWIGNEQLTVLQNRHLFKLKRHIR